MLYDSYVKRIEKLAYLRDEIYRRRYIILLSLAVIIALTVAFCIVKGNFREDISINSAELEYGVPVECHSKAVFSSETYLYRAAGTDEWSEEKPIFPGSYEVCARSKAVFGKKKYSSVASFNIKAIDIVFDYSGSSLVYGDRIKIRSSQELAYNDRVSDFDFSLYEKNGNRIKVTFDPESILIVNEDGEDVRAGYNIGVKMNEIDFTPKMIDFVTESAVTEYNGEVFSHKKWHFSPEKPAAYDDVFDTSAAEIITAHEYAGEYTNYIDIKGVTVKNSRGEDVTGYYEFGIVNGTLEIKKRSLTIKTGSATKYYDTLALGCDEYEVIAGELAEGDRLRLYSAFRQYSAIGTHENKAIFHIVNSENKNVTSSYDIQYEYGTIEITEPIAIVVKPIPLTQVYNGQYLTYGSNTWWTYNSEVLLEGDYVDFEFEIEGSRRDVGVSESKLITKKAMVYKADGTPASYYSIVLDTGTIEILPAKIEIASADIEINGASMTIETNSSSLFLRGINCIPAGYVVSANTTIIEVVYIPDGKYYNVYVKNSNGTIILSTAVTSGNIDNEITNVHILNVNGEIVTRNFEITISEGIIKLLKVN